MRQVTQRWAVVAVVTVLLVGCSGGKSPTTTRASTSTPGVDGSGNVTTVTTVTPYQSVDIVAKGATKLVVPGAPDWMAVAGGSAWTTTGGLTQLDGSTGAVLGTTALPGPVCLAMDVGFGSLWLGTCGTARIVRVDPKTGKIVATIPLSVKDLQQEGSIAAGEGAVWAISSGGERLVKVDPTTNAEVATYPAPPGATAVRAGFGSLWVTSRSTDTLYRIDPATGTVVAKITVGHAPTFLAVGEGGVWTLDQNDGTVTHIDPADNRGVASIHIDAGRISGGDIAAGGGFVWARVSSNLVAKIDAKTNLIIDILAPASGSGRVAADATAAWVSAHDVNTVWRLPAG